MIDAFKTLYQRMAVRRVFDCWAKTYDMDVQVHRYSAAQAVQKALPAYLSADSQIIDLGIGTGLIWDGLDMPGNVQITGLDIAPDMLAQASINPALGPLYPCDIGRHRWPVANSSQDLIVSAGLFEYLTQPMATHVFNEAQRSLKPDGHFITTYIPADSTHTQSWHGRSGRVLSCRYAPAWMEEKTGFKIIAHTDSFIGSVFADDTSYVYRLIILKRSV